MKTILGIAMRQVFLFAIIVALYLGFSTDVQAQISGNPTPFTGTTIAYSYSSGSVVSPQWRLSSSKGTILSQTQSGSTYTANILWNSTGSETIAFLDGQIPKATLTVTISAATVPPSAPTATAATSIATTSFTANWSSVSSASSYQVDISTVNTFASFVAQYTGLGATNKSVTGLAAGTPYYYRARAVNSAGSSPNSNTTTVLTSGPPPAPTSLSASTVTSNGFWIEWTPVSGATSYRMDLATNSSFSATIYNNVTVTGSPTIVSGLLPNTLYYFRLRAVHAGGTSVNSSTQSVTTAPSPPVATASTNQTSSSFTANWDASAGATSYGIEVSTSSMFTSLFTQILGITTTSVNITGMVTRTKYYYRVRAVNSFGTSNPSNVITAIDLDQNYVRTINVTVAGKTTTGMVTGATINQKITQYTFFDGLGRPKQTVIQQGSTTLKDVVQPIAYDTYGREAKRYLPYTDESNGWYKPNALKDPTTSVAGEQAIYRTGKQYAFYQPGGVLAKDQFPFAELRFEPSPLNRVVEQGSAGEDWQPDGTDSYTSGDHTAKVSYEVNAASEVIRWTYVPATASTPIRVVNAGYFPTGKLQKTRSKDEQQTGEVQEFKDTDGRVVLRKILAPNSQWAQTYYLYDAFGNLVVVLPPEAVKALTN